LYKVKLPVVELSVYLKIPAKKIIPPWAWEKRLFKN
jgi:hypothetical protein